MSRRLPHNGTETSIEAARSMEARAPTDAARILAYVHSCGAGGATCDQAGEALGLLPQTCSARFNKLKDDYQLVKAGRKRQTRSGCNAEVYITHNFTGSA